MTTSAYAGPVVSPKAPPKPKPQIGWLADVPEVPLFLKGSGLTAHSLIIGQSGSGKSFLLGRLLEEILRTTEGSVLILDPNADFVRFSEVEPQTWSNPVFTPLLHPADSLEAFVDLWTKLRFKVLSTRDAPSVGLSAHATAERAALEWPKKLLGVMSMLGLDMKTHAEEAHAIMLLLDPGSPKTLSEFEDRAFQRWTPSNTNPTLERGHLSVFSRAFELLPLEIWETPEHPATILKSIDDLESGISRSLCVDLASHHLSQARSLVARACLEALWTKRREAWFNALSGEKDGDSRKPIFVVIDEAHNLAPAGSDLDGPAREVRDILCRIATEGRKYGIYLILVTQRPSRLDETIRTQCDSLCVMKMNDRYDLELIEQSFGFVPQGWVARAVEFKLGNMLLAGSFVDRPVYGKAAPRRSVEGGRNIRDKAWLPYLRES